MNPKPEYDHLWKIILLGDFGVGKTQLVLRYADDTYTESSMLRIGVDFKVKIIQENGMRIKLQLWDTEGRERFGSVEEDYYRGAHGIIVVYDITDQVSFSNVMQWLREIDQHGCETVTKLLVGNKCDLHTKRAVAKKTAQEFADAAGLQFLETSAKDATNIEKCFMTMAYEIQKAMGLISLDGCLPRLLSNDPVLTTLDLNSCNIDSKGAKKIAKALETNTTLTTLDLSGNEINVRGAGLIAMTLAINTTLVALNLASNKIGEEGAERLATSLTTNSTLITLDLRSNAICAEGARSLARSLVANTTLTTLLLSSNRIYDEGAKNLAATLVTNTTLSTLDISTNLIDTIGLVQIAQALVTNTTLTALNLSWNNIGAEGAAILAKLLFTNTTLSILNLWSTNICNEGVKQIAAVLATNIALSKLDLTENKIDNEGAVSIARALDVNTTLTHLELDLNNIDDGMNQRILSEIQFNRSLLTAISYPYFHGHPKSLSEDQTLDFRNSSLHAKHCELFPFQSNWHGVRVIDLRDNPKLSRVPRSIGHLDPLITQEIRFDSFPSPPGDESRYFQLDTPNLIRVMKSKLQYDPPTILLGQYFNSTTQYLDLRRLKLNNEQASRLSLYEPRWWVIQRIDFTKNPQLTQIPACSRFLDPQITTRIDFDVDALIPSVQPFARSGSAAIIDYAKGLLEGKLVQLSQVKMIVVGRAAVGKTTLVRSLYGQKFDPRIPSTDGIDLGEFVEGGTRFMTWDFGGQKVYRYTHQLFLASNTLYLVLFKLTDPVTETLKELRFWLSSIASKTTQAHLLLIGTHLDVIQQRSSKTIGDATTRIVSVLSSEFPHFILSIDMIHAVSCVSGKEFTLKDLRRAILNAARHVTIEAPESFVIAQDYFSSLIFHPPLIPYNQAIQEVRSRIVGASDSQLSSILQVLDRLGLVSVFHQPRSPSGGLVVLRPQWIARLLSTIVTTKHRLVNSDTGLISRQALSQSAWTDRIEFPPDKHDDLIDVLIQLEVLFPIREDQYFVPCMLQEDPPELGFYIPRDVMMHSRFTFRRLVRVESSAVPVAVIPPLLIALSQHGHLKARWQQGCIAFFDSKVWLQLGKDRANQISVTIWGDCIVQTTHWLRRMTEMIVTRLTEFYHLSYSIEIPCPKCSSLFSFADLQNNIKEHQLEVRCPSHPDMPLRIDTLAPDLIFMDLRSEDRFVFDFDKMAEIRELGQGAFGRVLLMSIPQAGDTLPSCSSSTVVKIDSTNAEEYAVNLLLIPPLAYLPASSKKSIYKAVFDIRTWCDCMAYVFLPKWAW